MIRTGGHWTAPRVIEDVLAAARQSGAAEPTEIHVRSELHTRMLQEAAAHDVPVRVNERRDITHLDGIPLVVDEALPAFPGYEIHRVCVPVVRAAAA